MFYLFLWLPKSFWLLYCHHHITGSSVQQINIRSFCRNMDLLLLTCDSLVSLWHEGRCSVPSQHVTDASTISKVCEMHISRKYFITNSLRIRYHFLFFCYDATAQIGPRLPHCWGLYITHCKRHTQPVGLLWMSDQLVTKAATCTTHNKPKRTTAIPSAGFKPMIRATKRLQIYALHRTSTGFGSAPLRTWIKCLHTPCVTKPSWILQQSVNCQYHRVGRIVVSSSKGPINYAWMPSHLLRYNQPNIPPCHQDKSECIYLIGYEGFAF